MHRGPYPYFVSKYLQLSISDTDVVTLFPLISRLPSVSDHCFLCTSCCCTIFAAHLLIFSNVFEWAGPSSAPFRPRRKLSLRCTRRRVLKLSAPAEQTPVSAPTKKAVTSLYSDKCLETQDDSPLLVTSVCMECESESIESQIHSVGVGYRCPLATAAPTDELSLCTEHIGL